MNPIRLLPLLLAAAMLCCTPAGAGRVDVIVLKAHKTSAERAAWEVFVQMVTPAKGVKAVEYETWASDADIYGANPPKWPNLAALKTLQRSVGGAASAPKAKFQVASPADCGIPQDGAAGNFPTGACIGEEVRHNRPVFDYLSSHGLTTVVGLVKAYAGGKPIALPDGAVVAKADWVAVSDILKWQPAYRKAADVRRAFYTNTASLNGRSTEYALAGVSIQSRGPGGWLWMTFEHRSNPGRCDIIGCHDDFGAAQASVSPGRINSDYGPCAKTPALKAMFAAGGLDPVWNNYCLKGAQERYLRPGAKPTLLGNSVIERMNHGVPIAHISCITCHAYASFDKDGHPNAKVLPMQPIGAVDQSLMQGYDGADFLWGILSAK